MADIVFTSGEKDTILRRVVGVIRLRDDVVRLVIVHIILMSILRFRSIDDGSIDLVMLSIDVDEPTREAGELHIRYAFTHEVFQESLNPPEVVQVAYLAPVSILMIRSVPSRILANSSSSWISTGLREEY